MSMCWRLLVSRLEGTCMVYSMSGARADFSVLGMIAGGVEAEEKVREKYAEQGIDLSKGQSEPGE